MTIKEIFDNLDIDNINEYIKKKQEENLNLDFKVISP